jgi:hypothetical protein
MEQENIEIKIKEDHNMIISFSSDNKLQINVKEDIDLTEFVNRLYLTINEKRTFTLIKEKTVNPKMILIQSTIEEILNAYNECIDETDE